ncbi:MAG: hypothetical protein IKN72_05395 [Clostridia bacterium]|nr:hypothetical protein [Clostridia bacterium]
MKKKKRSKLKIFLVVLLCIAIVLQTVLLVAVAAGKSMKDSSPIVVIKDEDQVSIAGDRKWKPTTTEAPAEPADGENGEAPAAEEDDDMVKKILSGEQKLSDVLRGVLYKDSIVTAIMSAVYPMLYDAVKGMLLAPATGFHLYGNGKDIAKLMAGTPYTAVDLDGTRKPLSQILDNVGTNWKYMERKVKWTDENGEEQKSRIYDTIDWGVEDADTFYEALNDCAKAFSGLLETTLQNKEIELKITAEMVNTLLEAEGMPTLPGANLVLGLLPVATALNKNGQLDGTGRSGYEYGIVYLFNILGLKDGDYPSKEVFCGYEEPGDVFRALIETVLNAVDKLMEDPATNLASVLMNLANSIESGEFSKHMKKLSLFIDFSDVVSKITELAKIDLASKEYFNLGDTIINLVEGMGIPLSKGFDGLLQGLVKKLLGDGMKLPTFNTKAFLACGTATTLSNGNKVYKANANAAFSFLAHYVLQGDILGVLLDKVDIFNDKTKAQLLAVFDDSSDGVADLVGVVLKVVLSNIGKKPAA